MSSARLQKIKAPFAFPVHFTHEVFDVANPVLLQAIRRLEPERQHRAAVFVDRGALAAVAGLQDKIRTWFTAHAAQVQLAAPPVVIPGGEAAKNDLKLFERLLRLLVEWRLCRQSCVVIVGGGAVLDLAGLAASLVHRGLRVIRVPTTALAQCDSGVGVKTAINFLGAKNMLGTFAPPFAVINDSTFLDRLPVRERLAGVAEAFKVALIKDARFFDYLCRHAADLKQGATPVLRQVVQRCAVLHLQHIRQSGDPFEMGQARPLDFGHWAAHELERLSNYRIGHGQAVAAGIALDAQYAVLQGLLPKEDGARLLRALCECGLRLWYPAMEKRSPRGEWLLLRGLANFREHLGGELCITLPKGVGHRQEIHAMDAKAILAALCMLKNHAG